MDVRDEHLRAFVAASARVQREVGREPEQPRPRQQCLASLSLTWCTKVTDRGLEHVLAANPGMLSLEVSSTA